MCEREPWEQVFADMVHWKFEGEDPEWSVASAVGFMEGALGSAPGAKVLDRGCGLGRHSVELARRGYDVTGLEYSRPFVDVARRNAEHASVKVTFLQGDMRHLEWDEEFDAVVLWGNTFGMFDDDGNRQTLLGIMRAMKRSGRALVDTQKLQHFAGEA